MNRKEALRQTEQIRTLESLGFTQDEAEALRRISMTLRRWYELECGTSRGHIERDDATGKPFWVSSYCNYRGRVADRETGAIKRLDRIMADKTPLTYYLQTDPRGVALYILRPGDVPAGASADSCYSRGICVY